MIANHIDIADLIIKEPRLKEWEGENSVLENHIRDAFNRSCIELEKQNIDTCRVMTPLFLNEGSDIISSLVGSWVAGDCKGLKRFVVKSESFSEFPNCKFILEGSGGGVTVDEPVALQFDGRAEMSGKFSGEYNLYRYRIESDTHFIAKGVIYLVETTFDDLIVYKSLQNFFTAKYRKDDDNFASKMRLYEKKFQDELRSVVSSYGQSGCDGRKRMSGQVRVVL